MLSLYWARIRGKSSLNFLVYFSLMIIPSLKRDPRGQDQLDHHSNLLTCSSAPEAQFRQMKMKWRSLEWSWSSPGQGRQTACALGGQRAKCAHALAGACSIFAMVIISSSPSYHQVHHHQMRSSTICEHPFYHLIVSNCANGSWPRQCLCVPMFHPPLCLF